MHRDGRAGASHAACASFACVLNPVPSGSLESAFKCPWHATGLLMRAREPLARDTAWHPNYLRHCPHEMHWPPLTPELRQTCASVASTVARAGSAFHLPDSSPRSTSAGREGLLCKLPQKIMWLNSIGIYIVLTDAISGNEVGPTRVAGRVHDSMALPGCFTRSP